LKAIVGLGNPGPQYKGTRHNVGFAVVDELARRGSIGFDSAPAQALIARWRRPDEQVLLVKPLTFMNLSGQAIGELARYFKIEPIDLLVVVDEVQLPLGKLRARARGSAGGHNGLKDVQRALGTMEYPRLRIGIKPPQPEREVGDLADFVLSKMGKAESEEVRALFPRLTQAVEAWVKEGNKGALDVQSRFGKS
jgi:PTH1 family peptidyl-tRNA hydrolase